MHSLFPDFTSVPAPNLPSFLLHDSKSVSRPNDVLSRPFSTSPPSMQLPDPHNNKVKQTVATTTSVLIILGLGVAGYVSYKACGTFSEWNNRFKGVKEKIKAKFRRRKLTGKEMKEM